MKKNISKTILFLTMVAGIQQYSFAAEMQTASTNSNNMLTFVIAIAALIISLFSLVMVFLIKRQNQVDLVNAAEDMHLTVDSLKTTLSKDIKNVRKEINRNFRRDNQHNRNPQNTMEKEADANETTTESRPAQQRRMPHKKHYSRGRGQMPNRRPEQNNQESE